MRTLCIFHLHRVILRSWDKLGRVVERTKTLIFLTYMKSLEGRVKACTQELKYEKNCVYCK